MTNAPATEAATENQQVRIHKMRSELTGDHCDRLRKLVAEQIEQHARDFVLDMTATQTIDSQGLETLLWLVETAGEHLGQVRLANCQPHIAEIFTITRLTPHFDIHPDVPSAIQSLKQ